jgi:hypothetical protein
MSRPPDIRLIDTARVSPLPRLFPRRWIIKDLAQFWYSTLSLPITPAQRDRWLHRYLQQHPAGAFESIKAKIERKAAWIARHDAKLNRREPNRHSGIPR